MQTGEIRSKFQTARLDSRASTRSLASGIASRYTVLDIDYYKQKRKQAISVLANLEQVANQASEVSDRESEGLYTSTPAQKAEIFEIPADLLKKNSLRFSLRIVLAFSIIAVASLLMLANSAVFFLAGLLIQGAMYVHLIELQHSVLHLHAFEKNHRLNRLIGIILGIPMLISFSDFQYRHLRHHKYLGSRLNSETFSYQTASLSSWNFLSGLLDYSRWRSICSRIFRSFKNEQISDGQNPLMEKRIKQEYRLFGSLLAAAILMSLVTKSPWPLILWLVPLIVAEPVHFLLELPEHLGLKAHSNPNVFENTRIWGGSLFARWFSHNTNYHLAHHYNQLVPMHRLPELTKIIESRIPESSKSKSYPDFFIAVIRAEIRAEDGD